MHTNLVRSFVFLGVTGLLMASCWDDPAHELDPGNVDEPISEDTAVNLVDTNSSAVADTVSSAGGASHNSTLLPQWSGFGASCSDVSDCDDYPLDNKLCLTDVMKVIAAPGGYCTACCDTPGKDMCGPGVDCVGVSGAYLVCIERCDATSDCRTDDHWECRSMYYIPDDFPRDYCLPDQEHSEVTGPGSPDPSCPWPWV